MANEFNVLDPLGIAAALKKQADQMATQAGMKPLPDLPQIKLPSPLGILGRGNPSDRRGLGKFTHWEPIDR